MLPLTYGVAEALEPDMDAVADAEPEILEVSMARRVC
jgi:hypothetical protein